MRGNLLALIGASLLAPTALATSPAPQKLGIEVTHAASCSRPTRNGDRISVHYRGTLASNGQVFDESYKGGTPITFVLGSGHVIKGWDQGLLDMCPDEERTLTIPSDLAYGNRGHPPVIPEKATLVFETKLVDIVGVKQEAVEDSHGTGLEATPLEDVASNTDDAAATDTSPPPPPEEQAQCHLLGPFALVVQAALGGMALLALVIKRWRETNKRPWKVWFFDVSKQVLGSVLTHILNLLMSMLGASDVANAAGSAAIKASTGGDSPLPNPCSYYLLNLAIDTTIGIPILYLLLRVLHALAQRTPLAHPPESLHTGNYSQPPRSSWWFKQLILYFLGLCGMKLFVFFLFQALPWLPWVGDWALRWTEGNEALQVVFAMFIFPVCMNAVQYWIIDNFIMDKSRGEHGEEGQTSGGGGTRYQRVAGEEDDHDNDVEASGSSSGESGERLRSAKSDDSEEDLRK